MSKIYIIQAYTPYDYGAKIMAAFSDEQKAIDHVNYFENLKARLEKEITRLDLHNWLSEDYFYKAHELEAYHNLSGEIKTLADDYESLQIVEMELL